MVSKNSGSPTMSSISIILLLLLRTLRRRFPVIDCCCCRRCRRRPGVAAGCTGSWNACIETRSVVDANSSTVAVKLVMHFRWR